MNSIRNDMSDIDMIANSVRRIGTIEDLGELKSPYVDVYVTEEQQKRDKYISELLGQYLEFYKAKIKDNKMYKSVLYWGCIISVFIFSIMLCFIILKFFKEVNFDVSATVQLITASVTFLSLIFGILTIITKYVFPKGDEDYITRIVELIQKNDLQNKKENMKTINRTNNN